MPLLPKRFALVLLCLFGWAAAAQANETRFEDWSVICDEAGTCFGQMATTGPRLILGWDQDTREIRVGAIVTAKARADHPATIRLDNGTVIYLKVNACSENYCEAMARRNDTPKIVAQMKAAKSGQLGFLEITQISVASGALPRENVALQIAPLSLAGFPAALDLVVNQGRGTTMPEPLPQDPQQ